MLCACGEQKLEETEEDTNEIDSSIEATSEMNSEPDTVDADIINDESKEVAKVIDEAPDESEPYVAPEWSKAYSEYLKAGTEEISFEDNEQSITYALIYLDEDDIPELLIDTGIQASGEIVVTYHDGKIVEHYLYRIGSQYIEKSGLIYTDTGHMDYYPVIITKLEDGIFKEIASGIRYVSDEDYMKLREDPNYPYTLTFEWDGKTVTEDDFNASIAEYYDIDKGIYPNNYLSYGEMLYYLKNGTWYSSGHEYELVIQDCSWQEAQDICHDKGGYLATITCKDEAETVSELIRHFGYTDKSFFVGYRSCEKVGGTSYSYRWINKDGSYQEVYPSMYAFWAYNSPGYDYSKKEWSFEKGEEQVGLAKYFEETGEIYIFEAPDDILAVSPDYAGKLGFICEYD